MTQECARPASSRPAVAVVAMPAEMDLANIEAMITTVNSAIGGPVTTVVLDLTATRCCDSSGAGAVVYARELARRSGATLRLAVPSAGVRRVLEILKLDAAVPVYPDLAAALATCRLAAYSVAMTADFELPGPALAERAAAALSTAQANLERVRRTMSRLDATRAQLQTGRDKRGLLHASAYARLSAKLETLPVIEQAKGVLIAQTGCQPDEAFRMLCAVSQRANVKVRDLAAEIVSRAAAGRVATGHGPGQTGWPTDRRSLSPPRNRPR
jgi:anti-sigma B factor antagonist